MPPATSRNLRTFGFLLAAMFAALGLLWVRRASGMGPAQAILLCGALLSAVLAWAAPNRLRWIYVPWMSCANFLGVAMTCLTMTLFYFTVLVPFTVIRFQDPLRRRLGGASYWELHKDVPPTLERFRRPF